MVQFFELVLAIHSTHATQCGTKTGEELSNLRSMVGRQLPNRSVTAYVEQVKGPSVTSWSMSGTKSTSRIGYVYCSPDHSVKIQVFMRSYYQFNTIYSNTSRNFCINDHLTLVELRDKILL